MSSKQQNKIEFMTITPDNSMTIDTNKHDIKDDLFMNEPSCLDSPSSIKSPNSLSTTFSTPTKTSKFPFPVIRKLGAAEVVYDFEHLVGNVILVNALTMTSKIDLYSNLNLLNKSIYYWKQSQVLLRASIYTDDNTQTSYPIHHSSPTITNNNNNNNTKSTEKYFVYASDDKIQNNDNIKYYKLNIDSLNNNKNKLTKEDIEQICHETFGREYNLEFLDSKKDLLWRMTFIETLYDSINNEYNYYLIFSAHHAIADARNAHYLFIQLFDIIQNVYKTSLKQDHNYNCNCNNHVEQSIEERLYNNDPIKLSTINIKENPNFNGDTCKLLNEFLSLNDDIMNLSSLRKRLLLDEIDFDLIRFESLTDSRQNFSLKDIEINPKNTIRIRNFVLKDEFHELLKLCKKHDTKLTGCINVITALATRLLYSEYTDKKELLNIHYHLLANLRPFLDPPLDNYSIGYWAVVFGLCFLDDCDINDEDFWSTKFWTFAKRESDSLHEKIKEGEHFEMAKLDTVLMDQVVHDHEYPNGGGVHYALSNLGVMPSSMNQNSLIKVNGHYFGTSLQPNRWSSVIFHGLTTVDNSLCWAITYQSKLFRDEIVDIIVNNIRKVIRSIVSNPNS